MPCGRALQGAQVRQRAFRPAQAWSCRAAPALVHGGLGGLRDSPCGRALHGAHAAPHPPLAHAAPPLAPLAPAAAPAQPPVQAEAAAHPPVSSMAATGSISTDVDMQSVESSADSVLAPIALQVGALEGVGVRATNLRSGAALQSQ